MTWIINYIKQTHKTITFWAVKTMLFSTQSSTKMSSFDLLKFKLFRSKNFLHIQQMLTSTFHISEVEWIYSNIVIIFQIWILFVSICTCIYVPYTLKTTAEIQIFQDQGILHSILSYTGIYYNFFQSKRWKSWCKFEIKNVECWSEPHTIYSNNWNCDDIHDHR